jgi:hypothetical protein
MDDREAKLCLLREAKCLIDNEIKELEDEGVDCLYINERKRVGLEEFFKSSYLVDNEENAMLFLKSKLSKDDIIIYNGHVCCVAEHEFDDGDLYHQVVYQDDFSIDDEIWEGDVDDLVTFGDGCCIIWNMEEVVVGNKV